MRDLTGYLKRVIPVLLAGTMVLTAVPLTVYADLIDEESDLLIAVDEDVNAQYGMDKGDDYESSEVIEKTYEGNGTLSEADQEDPDALLEGYIDRLVREEMYGDGEITPDGVARRESLVGANQYMYDFLSKKIQDVAAGKISSTVFDTGTIDLKPYLGSKDSFTKEELGVSDLYSNEAVNAVLEKAGIDMSQLLDALLADYPYDLYWFDKTYGYSYSWSPSTNISGNSLSVSSVSYTINMYVSADYSKNSYTQTTNVNTTKTGAASNTVSKAVQVVEKAVSEGCTTDYDKLKYYKTYICDNTTYNNSAAAGGIAYGDPWQLIYVFDENPSTKVVCEGYSKAFKLLCDLSAFNYPSFDCYLMSGKMNGGNHMWNTVGMNDGKYYLVDVTNCDNDYYVEDNRLFLAGSPSESAKSFSVKRADLPISSTSHLIGDTIQYAYDNDTIAQFTETERTLAKDAYDPSSAPEPEPDINVSVTLDANGGAVDTDKITVVYGSVYGTLPTPSFEGNNFEGWYTSKSGGDRVLSTTTVTNKDAHTLYAHWSPVSSPEDPEEPEDPEDPEEPEDPEDPDDHKVVLNVAVVEGGKILNPDLAKTGEDGRDYLITIGDKRIAAVNNKGMIQGKKAGTTTATVIKKDREYTINISVVKAGFTAKTYRINTGDTVSPIFTTEAEISSYSSSKPDIAQVYPAAGGLYVVADKKGTSKITAVCNGKKYTATVNVYDPCIDGVSTLILDNKTSSLKVKNGYGKTTWESDNNDVVTVKNGKIKGLSKGTATITAVNNGRTMTKVIKVFNVPEFKPKKYVTSVGTPVSVVLIRDDDQGDPVYSVNNGRLAEIDEDGILIPKAKGTVKVTAILDGRKYTAQVKINP